MFLMNFVFDLVGLLNPQIICNLFLNIVDVNSREKLLLSKISTYLIELKIFLDDYAHTD